MRTSILASLPNPRAQRPDAVHVRTHGIKMADTSPVRVLVADDQVDILDAFRLLLSDEGYDVTAARSPGEALERLEASDFDLAILDLNYTRDTTSGQEGFDLMERIRSIDPTLPVLVVTAWSSVAGAVEAMRRGARDYIEKPWDDERLLVTVRTQIDLRRALRKSQRLQEANARLQRGATPVFIGDSPAILDVRQTIERIAPSDAAVLLTGEHGTGKEVAATWLHALSERRSRPLVTMNAGGLAEGIAESELFGHVKGAFTDARFDRIGCFELADEGTLFLDEIANMPVRLQAKLLRVLQTGELQRVGSSRLRFVNVRVLSATNARASGRDRRRPLPRGPSVSPEHRGHSPAAAARSPRGHRTARRALPGALRGAVPETAGRVRARRHGGAGLAPLARQRARARAQHRARGADGRRRRRRRSRGGTSACRARAGRRRAPRRCRSKARSGCSSRKSWPGTAATSGWRPSARDEPQCALSTAPAVWRP